MFDSNSFADNSVRAIVPVYHLKNKTARLTEMVRPIMLIAALRWASNDDRSVCRIPVPFPEYLS